MGHWGNILLNPLYQSHGDGGITYLLRDEFTTALTVGNVFGTAAEPGPGTRNGVDLDSKITISGGELVIDGSTNWGRVALWLEPGVDRQAGRVLIYNISFPTLGATTSTLIFGDNPVGSGALGSLHGIIVQSTGQLIVRNTADGDSPLIGTVAAATQYKFFIVLRTQGKYIFQFDGSVYRLLHEDVWSNAATIYPRVSARVAGGKANLTELKVPQSVFAVTALASDAFDRDNGALGNTDGAGHQEANSGSGLAWSSSIGTWAITSNVAGCATLDDGIGAAVVDTGNPDLYVVAKLTRSDGNIGLVTRYIDDQNYVYAYQDGTNATLRKVIGGVDSEVIAPVAITNVADAKMILISEGSTFELRYNNKWVGVATIADAGLQTSGKCGLFTNNINNTFNDFVAFKRVGWGAIDI